jgi:hypothetical protein
MAFGTPRLVARTTKTSRPYFQVDRNRYAEVWFVTKAGGDTTGLVITATNLKRIREVSVQAADDASVIYQEKDTTNGNVSAGFGSGAVTLNNLGANAVGLLITLIGNLVKR